MFVIKVDEEDINLALDILENNNILVRDYYNEKDIIDINNIFNKSIKYINEEFFDRYIKTELIDEIPYSNYRLWEDTLNNRELREEYSLEIMNNYLKREIFNMLSIELIDTILSFDILNAIKEIEITEKTALKSSDKIKLLNKARIFIENNYENTLWNIEELENYIRYQINGNSYQKEEKKLKPINTSKKEEPKNNIEENNKKDIEEDFDFPQMEEPDFDEIEKELEKELDNKVEKDKNIIEKIKNAKNKAKRPK